MSPEDSRVKLIHVPRLLCRGARIPDPDSQRTILGHIRLYHLTSLVKSVLEGELREFESFLESIDGSLGPSKRVILATRELGCQSIEDVAEIPDGQWLALPGFGDKALRLLKTKLSIFLKNGTESTAERAHLNRNEVSESGDLGPEASVGVCDYGAEAGRDTEPMSRLTPSDSITRLIAALQMDPSSAFSAIGMGSILGFALWRISEESPAKTFNLHEKNLLVQLKHAAWVICRDVAVARLGLTARATNCLQNAHIRTVGDLAKRSKDSLLEIPNLGTQSLEHLDNVLRSMGLTWGEDLTQNANSRDVPNSMNHGDRNPAVQAEDSSATPEEESLDHGAIQTESLTSSGNSALGRILVAASVVYGAETISDLRNTNIGSLLDACGFDIGELEIALPTLIPNVFRDYSISEVISVGLKQLSPRERKILFHREISTEENKRTLEELGSELGLTRERVRQIEKSAINKFDGATRKKLERIAVLYVAKLGHVFQIEILDQAIMSNASINGSPTGIEAKRQALMRAGSLQTRHSKWAISPLAAPVIDKWPSRIRKLSSRTGLIPSGLINTELAKFFSRSENLVLYLEEVLGLSRLRGEWLLSDSVRNRTLAGLYLVGRPATKEEIARSAGVEASRVSSYLSAFPHVRRAGKGLWAFEEWIEDEYNGIVGEIVQRIQESGGSTTVRRLVKDLPRQFGVSESSVRTYLATPRFVVENGDVREATHDEIEHSYYGLVENHPDAIRLEDGAWAAKVKLEARFFDGYSAGIPQAIAYAQGIRPGDSLEVPVEGFPHRVSLIWRLQSTNGRVDLGRIQALLSDLGVSAGDSLVVSPSRESLRVWQAGKAPLMRQTVNDAKSPSIDQDLDDFISDIFKKK